LDPDSKPLHVSIGNFNIDVVLYVDRLPGVDESVNASDTDIRPGGAAVNYAVAVARYGHRASLVASVADNQLVKANLELVRSLGVDVTGVTVVNSPPGVVVVMVYPDGSRSMIRSLGANVLLSPDSIDQGLLDAASIVHMATLHPEKATHIVHRINGGCIVSYDPGVYVESSWEHLRTALIHTNILFLNRKEYLKLRSKLGDRGIFDTGLDIVVVKLGDKGAVALTREGGRYHAYTKLQGKPVDTTGAGDAFNAFFNAAYIDFKDVREALRYGVAAGALKTLCKGSMLCWDPEVFHRHLHEGIVREVEEELEVFLGR